MQRHLLLLEQRLRAAQIRKTRRVGTLDTHEVAAREQRLGEHLIVMGGGADRYGLLVQCLRARRIAGGFVDVTFAGEEAGLQAFALGQRQQCSGLGDFTLGDVLVPLGLVVTQDESRADLEIGVRLFRQQGQRLIGEARARVGIDPHRLHGLLYQFASSHRLRGRLGKRRKQEIRQHGNRCHRGSKSRDQGLHRR